MDQTRGYDPFAAYGLDEILLDCLSRLSRGVADRRSALHTPMVGTIGLDGRPRQRVVVLRQVDAPNRILRFHTDIRSEKVAELARDPRIALTGYDPGAKIQIRIEGSATVHGDDGVADAAWTSSRPFSRACYGTMPSPGQPMAAADAFTLPTDPDDLESGRANFCAVHARIESLEWLFLKHDGHRRARFVWDDFSPQPAMMWLVP